MSNGQPNEERVLLHSHHIYLQATNMDSSYSPKICGSNLFPFIVFFFLFALPLILLKLWISLGSRKREAPEPRERWPLIGHPQLLLAFGDLVQTLNHLADQYGPAITLRLGFHRTLVVSSMDLAKECFTTNDQAFADRPLDMAGYYLGYRYAMVGLTPYGPYWRHIRKIVTVNLLSSHRIGLLQRVRVAEADELVRELYGTWAGGGGQRFVKVDMRQKLSDFALNTIGMVVIGKRCATNRGLRVLLSEWMALVVGLSLSEAIPFLRWIGLDRRVQAMKRVSSQLDGILQEWLSEHRARRSSGDNGEERVFADTLISTIGEADDADTTIKATILAMILGGSETVFVSLAWTLYLLVTHGHVMKKAQDELDFHVGKKRHVDESDLKKLVYLDAIIKESFRIRPTAPLLVPRQALEDCHVGGFFVPAGTRLFVNILKIQMDPLIWPDPTVFKPERFMDRNVDLGGKSFELMPFGSGRRVCPGANFALSIMQLMLARLVHGFELELHPDSPVDNPAANGFDVLLTPRLPASLYSA